MKNLLILYLVFISWGQLIAQPGYIGKKTPISIEGFLFPNLLQVLNQEQSFRVNARFGGSIEHVLSRRLSIGLSANWYQTQMLYEKDSTFGMARISGSSIGFDTRFYSFSRRGNIAPLGPYQKVSIFYTPYRIIDLDQQFYDDKRSDLGTYRDIGVSVTIGSQRILKNVITYHWGIQLGWLLNVFRRETLADEIYLKEISNIRLRGSWGFNFHGGIGILIF